MEISREAVGGYVYIYGAVWVCVEVGSWWMHGAEEVDRHTDGEVYPAHLHTTTTLIQDSNQPISWYQYFVHRFDGC